MFTRKLLAPRPRRVGLWRLPLLPYLISALVSDSKGFASGSGRGAGGAGGAGGGGAGGVIFGGRGALKMHISLVKYGLHTTQQLNADQLDT